MSFKIVAQSRVSLLMDFWIRALPDFCLDKEPEAELEIQYDTLEFAITVSGTLPIVVRILPYSLPVRLKFLSHTYGVISKHLALVKTIRDLVSLIRHEGSNRVGGYQVEFLDQDKGSIEFKDDQLVFQH